MENHNSHKADPFKLSFQVALWKLQTSHKIKSTFGSLFLGSKLHNQLPILFFLFAQILINPLQLHW